LSTTRKLYQVGDSGTALNETICGRMIGVISSQIIFSKSFGVTDKTDIPLLTILENRNDKGFFLNSKKNASQ
jgi:hypothetical protein